MSSSSYRGSLLGVGLVLLLVASPRLQAGDLRFTWDPSSGATGYRLHYGSSPGQYTSTLDVGASTQGNLTSLPDCSTRYYAVKAYNAAGDSGFSNEVSSWPRPVLTSPSQSTGQRGTQAALVFTGTNYQTGTTVAFSGTGITVNSVSIASCTQMTVNVTISSTATLGPRDITITAPNGVAGTATAAFSVVSQTLPTVQNLRRTDVQ